jgi:hypothetical protein
VAMLFKTTLLSRSKARAYNEIRVLICFETKKKHWALEMQHLYQMKTLLQSDLLVDPFPFFRF